MDYQKYDHGSYNLHVIKTKKFKTITVEINFRTNINAYDITIRNFLETILLDTTNEFNTPACFIKEIENLYDIKVRGSVRHLGNYSLLTIGLTFLNPKYTKHCSIIEALDFLMKILFKPNVKDKKFDKLAFERTKRGLENKILIAKDNKKTYAMKKLLSSMSDLPYSYDITGVVEDLEKITEESIFEYYQSVLNSNLVDVLIIGDVETDEICGYFRSNFKIDTFKKERMDYLVKETPIRKRINRVSENAKTNQSVLAIGLTLHGLTNFERRYVLHVYAEILGGGSGNSLLFDNVRSKNSLAYYIGFLPEIYNNIGIIYAGIKKEKYDLTLKLIKKTIESVEKGHFDNEKIESSKESIISSMKASEDNPLILLSSYYIASVAEGDTIESRKKKIATVTKEDIIGLSKKIKMHTIFLLEEANNEEN